MMLSGYGMNAENRAKSAGNFNSLWDTGEVSVARGLDGRIQLYDRRLSLHWLIQPEVARSAMHDPLLTLIGFWPRFLVAWPESSIPRKVRLFRPELDGRISAYWQRCHELLAAPLGDDCRNLQLIEATDRAQALLGTFFERMETAKMASSILTSIRPFALRATEMTFRIAGVLAVFEGKSLIDPDAASRAITLATYSIETWRNIFGNRDEADARALALGLFGWLLKQDGCQVREASILHIGLPKRIRSKDRRDSALALLEQHRLVERERDVWFVRRPEKC
jgi:hypothetical protein